YAWACHEGGGGREGSGSHPRKGNERFVRRHRHGSGFGVAAIEAGEETTIMSNSNAFRKTLFALAAAALWVSSASPVAAQSRPLYIKRSVQQWNPLDLMPLVGAPPVAIDLRDVIYLDRVPAAASVADANQLFDKRAAAAIRVIADYTLDSPDGDKLDGE